MRKIIEFQTSNNDTSALLTRGKSSAYEDLVLGDTFRKYRHQFELGKTRIRLLPTLKGGNDWLLQIPTLQHPNGRHAHPRTVQADAQSVFDTAYSYMQKKHPAQLFSRSNKSGIRLLPSPMSLGWAIVDDANGIKLRLIHHSFYNGWRGGPNGLGNLIYEQVLRAGRDRNEPSHPLNPSDGTSLCVERISNGDGKFPSYRVSLSNERGPLQPLLDKISDVEFENLCPLEETVRILSPEEEWRLLAKVVGDEMAAEIRAAQESGNTDEECGTGSNVEEAAVVEETAVAEEDYKDFPTKWEI